MTRLNVRVHNFGGEGGVLQLLGNFGNIFLTCIIEFHQGWIHFCVPLTFLVTFSYFFSLPNALLNEKKSP